MALAGDARAVVAAYERFRRERQDRQDGAVITVGLGFWKGLMSTRSGVGGTVSFDLARSEASLAVTGPPGLVDVWVIENSENAGGTVAPEPGDRMIKLATVTPGRLPLTVDLRRVLDEDLRVDLVAVTRPGESPVDSALACGAATLFERLWAAEQREHATSAAPLPSPGLLLSVAPSRIWATAAAPRSVAFSSRLADLIAEGEQVFFEETFGGNGRTCGTCHPAENNFTIDAEFIASLHPGDPLFVAEFIPELNVDLNGGERFETPDLMRQFGLITINPDGFEDTAHEFVLRSVSHTFAQALQRDIPVTGVRPPLERLGWSGDGSPGDGTLRSFAIGAVVQHFPRTMKRIEGSDFRLPTDHELDALEAFQLSLGRQEETGIEEQQMVDATAELGRSFFTSACIFCHRKGGANTFQSTGALLPGQPAVSNHPIANGNFDTGVELLTQLLQDGTGFDRPHDGGFGTASGLVPLVGGGPAPRGDGSFNTPSVVEFADTVPGFHSHLTAFPAFQSQWGADPVLAAVRFYATDEFLESSGAQVLNSTATGALENMTNQQARQVATFLRAINAAQNAADALGAIERLFEITANLAAISAELAAAIDRLGVLARADIRDGMMVLSEIVSFAPVVAVFQSAADEAALGADPNLNWNTRVLHWQAAVSHLSGIHDLIYDVE